MRIDRLDLERFGCFTDCSLDLSGPGTHVVVGLNETGKTTAMAAIRQLLFGIPVRSPHAFLHEKRDLRLGAVLRDTGGEQLEITRVKRQADTLLDVRGEILAEAVLARFRHDVDEALYASLFNIGHDEIVHGGEALLDSDGELGRALFSASRGTSDLNAVLRKLDEDADALFKRKASKPKLNAAIRGYKEEAADASRCSTPASKVVKLDDELRVAKDALDRTGADRKEKARQKAQLERIRAARPQLANRRDCLLEKRESESLGPLVDPAVGPRLGEAQAKRNDGEAARRAAQAAIGRLDRKLSELSIDSTLLGQRDAIDQFRAESGSYRQNLEDLPGLVARAASLERDLDLLGRRLPDGCPVDHDGQSGLTVDQEERIRHLAEQHPELKAALEHASDQATETKSSLDAISEKLAALDEPVDVDTLVTVTARVRKAGDLEAVQTEMSHELETIDAALASDIGKLGLGDIDPRAVDAVAEPSVGTIRQFRDEFAKLAGAVARLEEEIKDLESQHDDARCELAELLRVEQPLKPDDLTVARTRRDEGWLLVRGVWLEKSVDPEAVSAWSDGGLLVDAYEAAVKDADDVADRLRDDASAVEHRASLERKLEDINGRLDTERGELGSARLAHDDTKFAWAGLWKPLGIDAESPDVMEVWHDGFRHCAQRSDDARSLAGKIAGLDDTIARHRGDLLAALSAVTRLSSGDMSLLGLLDHADQEASAAAEARQRRDSLTKSRTETEVLLRRHAGARDGTRRAMVEWQDGWAEAVTALGMGETATPNDANAVLKALSEITGERREFEDIQGRVAGIESRNVAFAGAVEAVLVKLDGHDDLDDASPDIAVTTLGRRLDAAQNIATKRSTTAEERESHVQYLSDADLEVAEAEDHISQMVVAAEVADEAQLCEAILRSEKHAALVGRIAQAEEHLRAATGLAISQIESEAAEMDGVEIDPEIEELDQDIERMDDTLKSQGKLVGELTKGRSLIGASGEAADHMTRAQHSLAAVVTYADEYVRVILAKQILEEQVSVYRDEHQGPLLDRARKLFRKLTLNSYLGLDTDTDAKGDAYLLARSAADKLLEIGALSSGTRDQLYLALRLAALEQFIDRRGPLPLVLDDLFVHFDDERTAAGLAVLDQLADQTQVLLFTHHEQVANQAREVIDADRLTVHQLA